MSPAPVPVIRLEIGAPDPGASDVPPGVVRQSWRDNDGRIIATGGRDRDSWWMHWRGLATFWFDEAGPVRSSPVRHGIERQLRDAFRRGVVPVVLLARGFEALHASGVLVARGVVGLCGRSGTGKSTLALALSDAGVNHFADDTIVYQVRGDTHVAIKLPCSVRVDRSARRAIAARHSAPPAARSGTPPLHRIYHLVRDDRLDPLMPEFTSVPPVSRFELLLAHAHPFELGSADRRRAFIEHLLTIARTVDVWECRFAPALTALPSLAGSVRKHATLE